ncbi:glyoxylate/hydroxypyruvate reductase A [Burkholderiaceae bacterium FT117]|uniref:2-hydroxyacid dehydrogenase n=1 Tax=Zeimonas sediminis TaxID=2944268 RepID=UPI002342BE66|nr:glyoxylate/hydroxypyruvate reductase A [Zeimonas sediminis]MCM5571489.1 glyoxylate/hydroxypyruvate reductase A [Zeimonas sediminis]
MLRISIAHPEAEARERWCAALSQLLPAASVEGWRPGAEPADYAVSWYPEPGFFGGQTRLRALFSAGAGVDHLLRHPDLPSALPIVRLEDAGMAEQMVEYCLHEVLRVQRRVNDYEALQRERRWEELRSLRREELPIGVFGLGVLGEQVARAFAALGYPVRGFSRSPKAIDGVECFDDRHGLRAFLEGCRVLVLLAPLTPDTRDLFDAERLGWLPQGAWLVNVARGGLVVDEALLAAADSGRLAGATLDVFREEPLPAAHPFWGHPRIRMTPHVSAVTLPEVSARQVAAKIEALERGEPVSGLVDRRRGY